MTLKVFIRRALDQGYSAEEAQRAAVAQNKYASWSYVRKVTRDYSKETGKIFRFHSKMRDR